MKLDGKGIIIVNVNGTMNYIQYGNNKELKEIIERFYKKQSLRDITIVDCEDKKLYFIDTNEDYEEIFQIADSDGNIDYIQFTKILLGK